MSINIKKITLCAGLGLTVVAGVDAHTLTGKVIDLTNRPIQDVVITCSGAKTVRTAADGSYTIDGVDNGATVNFIREGYYPQSHLITNIDGGKKQFTVHMVSTTLARHNETLILPSGKEENNLSTAGVENLNRKDFALGAFTVDKAMKGNFTGLNVINKSGMPGEGAFMQLRGVKSLVAENAPLVVVNGVPYIPDLTNSSMVLGYSPSVFKAFNSQDIRNITVLKGSEAAQYGSLGSNGVIMVETDQATASDMNTRITLSAIYGHNWNSSRIPMMNAGQYKSYLSDMGLTYYANQEMFFKDFAFLTDPNANNAHLYGYDTDWQNEIYRNSNTRDLLFRVEGGDNIAKYNISLGYLGNDGTIRNTSANRYNAQVNASMLVSRQIEIQTCINAAYLNGKFQEQSISPEVSPMISAYRRSPLLSPYASDMYGNLIDKYSSYWYGAIQKDELIATNPLAVVNTLNSSGRQYDMNSKLMVTYRPIRNLAFNGVLSMFYNYNQEETFIPGKTNNDIAPLFDRFGQADNSVRVGTHHTFNMYYAFNGDYRFNINRLNSLNIQAGVQAMTTENEYDAAYGRNTNNDFYQTLGDVQSLGRYFNGYNNSWNWLNLYTHVDYHYANLLKVGFTGSWDGASSIGKDTNRMSFYPAGEVVLKAKQFGPILDLDLVDKLNLYANYGLTGNSRYSSKLGKYYYTSTPYQTIAGIVRANVPNTRLTAETDYTLNLGFETTVWNNRVNLGAGYYNIDARNVLMTGVRSSVLGTSTYYNNDARISSKGFEANFTVIPVATPDFRWMVGANISTVDNKVKSLGSLNEIVNQVGDGAAIITRVGEDPFAFYGYESQGVFSTTAEANAANLTNRSGVKYGAGDMHYTDMNGDGVINDSDKKVLGSATPDFFGSIFTMFEYKNFALDVTFAYSHGNQAYNAVRRITESGKDFSNQSTAMARRWSMEGQVTDIPRVAYGDKVGNNDFSDRWIEDASYIKLRNVTLSYNWNKPVLKLIQGGTVYVTGENLLCSTKYLGLDPEFSYSNQAMWQGVDYGKVGAPRSVQLGVQLKF